MLLHQLQMFSLEVGQTYCSFTHPTSSICWEGCFQAKAAPPARAGLCGGHPATKCHRLAASRAEQEEQPAPRCMYQRRASRTWLAPALLAPSPPAWCCFHNLLTSGVTAQSWWKHFWITARTAEVYSLHACHKIKLISLFNQTLSTGDSRQACSTP